MPTLTITLSDEELAGLTDYANKERRTPAAQAAYFVATFIESLQEDQREPFIISGSPLDPFTRLPDFAAPNTTQQRETIERAESAVPTEYKYQDSEGVPEPQRAVLLNQRDARDIRDRSVHDDMPPRGRAFQINR